MEADPSAHYTMSTTSVNAPVKQGDVVGTLDFTPVNGQTITYNLVATRDVESSGLALASDAPMSLDQIQQNAAKASTGSHVLGWFLVILAFLIAIVLYLLVLRNQRRRRVRRRQSYSTTYRYTGKR